MALIPNNLEVFTITVTKLYILLYNIYAIIYIAYLLLIY